MKYLLISGFLYLILSIGISGLVHGSEWEGVGGALRSAAYDGDVQRTIAALDEGADINSQTKPDKPTALMYAAKNGHTRVVRLLLTRGADPNILTSRGVSAIDLAMQHRHPDTAITLLEHGADPNIMSPITGQTLLQDAAANGYTELLSKLLEEDINVNMGNPTALELASKQGHIDVVDVLLRRGVDVNLNPDGKLNALDVAKIEGHTQIVNMLKAAGAVETQAPIDDSPAGNFKNTLVQHISDPKLKQEIKYQDSEGFYRFGLGICNALKHGGSKKQILEDSYYHFLGVEISDAMWETALEVVCPELAP